MSEAPCEMNGVDTPDIGGTWFCPLELGLCTICGKSDGLPWTSMMHETYGLWWVSGK